MNSCLLNTKISQKSEALNVPGILMVVKVKDKVQTVAARACQRQILISTEGSGLELGEGGSRRRQTGCKEKGGLQSALAQRTFPGMAPAFYCRSESPRILPSL